MKKILTLCVGLLLITSVHAQKKVTISGYVTDSETGETLIGAAVLSGPKTGSITNNFGYYSLTIPAGETTLQYSYVGYSDVMMQMNLQRDTLINISLSLSETLQAAKVTGRSSTRSEAGIASTYLGSIDVPVNQVKNTPVLFGESDVLKALQTIPGVQGGNEGFTGLIVRGGGPDENLVLLDGTPIYSVDHMLGLFSVFQTEAVKKVTLYKGSFPARYGGRVSSIVDIRTNDGNLKETSGSVTVGLLNSRLHLEGPIIKDRLSYSFSARGLHTAYLIPIIRMFVDKEDMGLSYYFYDINGKISWRLSDKDRFFFGFYTGSDKLKDEYTDEYISGSYSSNDDCRMSTRWGNDVVHLRWNHVFSNRLFSNATVAFNKYDMRLFSDENYSSKGSDNKTYLDNNVARYNSGIKDWSARIDFEWHPSPSQIVRFGSEYLYHNFKPETFSTIERSLVDSEEKSSVKRDYGNRDAYYGHEVSAHGEYEYTSPWGLTVNPGLRATVFAVEGRTYYSLQPRVNVKYEIPDRQVSIKAGYSRMAQYVHLLGSLQISMPTDLWVPITKDIRPITSDQVSAGIYYDGIPGWEFSAEGYYKLMNNILEYSDGAIYIGTSSNWEERVEMGKGRARGIELMAQKTAGRLTGWAAYTLSKSERRFPDGEINFGRWFPYKYDRRHVVNVNMSYKLTKKIDFNAVWSYASGSPITIPENKTVIVGPSGYNVVSDTYYYPARNNWRIPSSHHLDVSFAFHNKKKRGQSTWTLGVYNIYDRRNPNFYTLEEKQDKKTGKMRLRLKTVTILPFVPSVSYTRDF